MWIRKSTLEKVGLLDENSLCMEKILISYRIQKVYF